MKKKTVLSLVGCCLACFWTGSVVFGFPGVMATYWQEHFGVGNSETGLVVTLMLAGLAVAMFFNGKIHRALGTRRCITVGTIGEILVCIIPIFATRMEHIWIWAFLFNLPGSLLYGPCLATAQKWLWKRRGLASGMVNLTFGISAAIVSPIWNTVLETKGNVALMTSLIICLGVTNLIASRCIWEPDLSVETESDSIASFTPKQAAKTSRFWLIWFTWVFMGAAGVSMVSLSKSYALSIGISSVSALAAYNITNGIGRIIAGELCDKIGCEKTAIVAFVIASVGYALLPHLSNQISVCVLAACIGYGIGTIFTITSPLVAVHFGPKYASSIFGVVFTAYGFAGSLLGPTLSGIILDRTHNYTIIFSYLAVCALIGAVLQIILYQSRKKLNNI